MKKIALLGCNGFIGNYLVNQFKLIKNFNVDGYSHNPKKNQFHIKEILDNSKKYDEIIFLLNSKIDQKKIINILKRLNSNEKTRIIFFSTFSIYSSFHSTYAKNKIKLESILKKKKNWLSLRVGFVDSKKHSSYNKIFNYISKKKFIILPASNSKTAFISIEALTDELMKVILNRKLQNKTLDIYTCILSIKEFIKVKKFQGIVTNIPLPNTSFIGSILTHIDFIIPTFIQSVLSIVFMKYQAPINKKNDKSDYFFRRIFLTDYFNTNQGNIKHNRFRLRSIYYELINEININEYLLSTKNDRFIYHLRLNELISLEQKK